MHISLTEDIRSVTELKRNTRKIFDQIHQTGRPIVLTINGKADAVIMDIKTYEEQLKARNLALLLAEGEKDIQQKRTYPARAVLKELKNAYKIRG